MEKFGEGKQRTPKWPSEEERSDQTEEKEEESPGNPKLKRAVLAHHRASPSAKYGRTAHTKAEEFNLLSTKK